ncbi:hypothetical protein HYG86_00810 [Alkalicella caledoniensis]|uniref:Capsule polysaccharide biosynthesis protein n=1 Tax=Alkalicella caledoniensis TaxID=2731377 RepID=A0A7G9W401_ALKCA|nr:hypothetical protein [Alkalicella caledoniensis]QNO13413.1 hypothetical protein HYG86_00810 [Alkalicella caledoniensis]
MNILFLVNNAPQYINFFKSLGDNFKLNNHNVIYACESHLPEVKYDTSLKDQKTFYFTDHLNLLSDSKLQEYQNRENLRKFYYSCYDRNFHFGFDNVHDKKSDEIILRLLDFYEKIILQEDIDIVVYENVSNSFAYAAYVVAKQFERKYYGLITSRVPNHFEIWEDEFGNLENRMNSFNKLSKQQIEDHILEHVTEYLNNFKDSSVKPDYMKKNHTSMDINYLKYYINKSGVMLDYFKYYTTHAKKDNNAYQSSHMLIKSFKQLTRNLKRKIKISALKNKYDYNASEKDNFFIYPMHFQPESSTSVNAIFYDNQYEAIKNISFSLPIGTYLYVKDHPNGIGFLQMNFYKKIKKLPNVKYINPQEDTKKLIIHSKGVITLTSTMGYEALLLEKPVITLGKVFYNYHPYCYNISSYNDIFSTVQKVLFTKHSQFSEYNTKFLCVYFRDIYIGKIFNTDSDFNQIYKSIMNRIINKN